MVTLAALQVFVVDGAVAPAGPPAYALNSSSLTNLASGQDVPLRLFKCDFSHYMPVSGTRGGAEGRGTGVMGAVERYRACQQLAVIGAKLCPRTFVSHARAKKEIGPSGTDS